jgi:hypothetical protein
MKQKQRTNMKTTIALAIAMLIATATHAEVVTKGGGLAKGPRVSPGKASVTKTMNCPKCTSEFVTIPQATFKGSAPVATTVERHACNECGTKWVTHGHGKAKVEMAVHTCGNCNS